jgi:hypothetical protein
VYKLEEVTSLIIKSDSKDLPENFVASAVLINEKGIAYHAGIVIGYQDERYLFHYTGLEVKLEIITKGKWYFHKELTFIAEDEVSAFINHCKVIEQEANPEYGYFFGGSFYDTNGKYFSENGTPEIMTCVSFCLNVILGFIESDEYITFADWNVSNQSGTYRIYHPWGSEDKNAEEYIEYFINSFSNLVKDVNLDALKANLRRIYPVEYLSTAFVEAPPIRKVDVDIILPFVEKALEIKRAS